MSRKLSHTPPMPTFADMQLAEKLRREIGAASGPETQPENVAHVAQAEPAPALDNPNAQYAAPQPLPKSADVKTLPNGNVILEITMPLEVTAAAARGERAKKVPSATVPGLHKRREERKKKAKTRAAILGILGGAGLAVCVIFVAFARPSADAADKPAATMVATTTMASVAPAVTVVDIPAPEPVVTTAAVTAVTAAAAEPVATAPSAPSAPVRSGKPSPASSATPPAPVPFQKDDIDRQIR